MINNLDDLRKIAEAPGVRPGPWHVYDRGIGYEVHDENDYELTGGMRETFDKADAEFIATFDPPTVLALLSRLEQAERNADTYQKLYEQRAESLEQAEQAAQRVREGWDEYKSKLGAQIPEHYRRNIDGALTGHWKTAGGTPTGEFADVCSCGKSYWPCDALDGDGRG